MWEVGTFCTELSHDGERIQRGVLQLRHSGTLGKVLPQPAQNGKQRKRERKRGEWERSMDEMKRKHEVS